MLVALNSKRFHMFIPPPIFEKGKCTEEERGVKFQFGTTHASLIAVFINPGSVCHGALSVSMTNILKPYILRVSLKLDFISVQGFRI